MEAARRTRLITADAKQKTKRGRFSCEPQRLLFSEEINMTGTKFAIALMAAACTLAACTTHRTIVERPGIVERDAPASSTVVVPPGSDVTIEN